MGKWGGNGWKWEMNGKWGQWEMEWEMKWEMGSGFQDGKLNKKGKKGTDLFLFQFRRIPTMLFQP